MPVNAVSVELATVGLPNGNQPWAVPSSKSNGDRRGRGLGQREGIDVIRRGRGVGLDVEDDAGEGGAAAVGAGRERVVALQRHPRLVSDLGARDDGVECARAVGEAPHHRDLEAGRRLARLQPSRDRHVVVRRRRQLAREAGARAHEAGRAVRREEAVRARVGHVGRVRDRRAAEREPALRRPVLEIGGERAGQRRGDLLDLRIRRGRPVGRTPHRDDTEPQRPQDK